MDKKLENILGKIEPADQKSRELAKEHILNLAMPPWALGDLLDLAVDLAGIQRRVKPVSGNKMIFTMAADHGVAESGVSAYPQEVTIQMAGGILAGGAGVNALAKETGCEVCLVDMGVKEDLSKLYDSENLESVRIAPGTENMLNGPAMTREQAIEALVKSYELVSEKIEKQKLQIVGTGELGIGNTTPATAILSVLAALPVNEITGRGTGLNDQALEHKKQVIDQAITINDPNPKDAIDVLSKVGGYDIAGIAGTVLAAAVHKIPVVVDGFISTAGALIAYKLNNNTLDYIIPSHRSAESGHDKMWEYLGKKPLLDLNLRLGEGTGGAIAMHLIDCACSIVNDMLTFESGGISDSDQADVENFE